MSCATAGQASPALGSMKPVVPNPAAIAQSTPQGLALSGGWTARGIGAIERRLESLQVPAGATADGTAIEALDSAGAWVLQKLLRLLAGIRNRVKTVKDEARPEVGGLR